MQQKLKTLVPYAAAAVLMIGIGVYLHLSQKAPRATPVRSVPPGKGRTHTSESIPLPEDIKRFWRSPIEPQGPAPTSYAELEKSLRPEDCGVCHAPQFELWRGSRHAAATGPGIHAQLLHYKSNPRYATSCSWCHFPLWEQHASKPRTAEANPDYDEQLYRQGLTCAACHVRKHQRFGPPRGDPAPLPEPTPHGGFTARDFFSTSEFCAQCHQFRKGQTEIAGKFIENTFQEWKGTEQARAGIQCQGCHMPDRKHLWRGIHDKEMTRSGVTIALEHAETWLASHGPIMLTIANTGTGHHFPTYVTPALRTRFTQLDRDGRTIPETIKEFRIGRHLPIDLSEEIEDSRIAAGQSARFQYDVPRNNPQASLRVEIEVDPDEFYRRLYEARLKNKRLTPEVRSLYEAALAETLTNKYQLWSQEVGP